MNLLSHVLQGTGISRSVAIKATVQMIHNSPRETHTTSKYHPTPQEIVLSNNDIDTNLFYLISWIAHLRGQVAKNGRVFVAQIKSTNVITDNRKYNRNVAKYLSINRSSVFILNNA